MKAKVIELKNYKKPYRLTKCQWDNIRRANNPSKILSHNALKVLTNIVYKLKKAKVVTMNHEYLTINLTRCKYEQNNNILDELREVLNIKFNRSGIANGKKYRDRFEITANENTYEILENPKLFYESKSRQTTLKTSDTALEKFRELSEKIQTDNIIYRNNTKEEIEDSSLRAISSISEKEKNKKEKEIGDESLSSLLVLEAANQTSDLQVGLETKSRLTERSEQANAATQLEPFIPENSPVKKPEQPCAKIIPLNAEAERELQKRRLHRIGDSRPRNDQNFTLLGDLLKGVELLKAPPELPETTKPSDSDNDLSEHSANTALSLSNQGTESMQTNLTTSETSPELTTTKEENSTMAVQLKPTTSDLWNTIRQEALASLEHEVDRWDLTYDFNDLEVTEDTENSRFEIRGSKSVITNMHKHHYKAFTKAFYKITTNHTFEFVKALK